MRNAVLLYNPLSGARRKRRQAELEAALGVLRAAGVHAELVLTRSSDDASEQARQAVAAGCDTIFACGGDGTIHDVLQGMAGSQAALGVLPMGTANALAHDLGLPLRPAAAARVALTASSRRIALGRLRYQDFQGQPAECYFTVAAGIGVDAHLFYKLTPAVKQQLGMAGYYLKAWHLWMTHRMRPFVVDYVESGGADPRRVVVTELLAVRIRNFGGVLRELAPGASLRHDDVRLVLCRTASRTWYLLYVLRGLLRQTWSVPGVELVSSDKVSCQYLLPPAPTNGGPRSQPNVYVEADGELLGRLPAEISIVPDALSLLVPSQ